MTTEQIEHEIVMLERWIQLRRRLLDELTGWDREAFEWHLRKTATRIIAKAKAEETE